MYTQKSQRKVLVTGAQGMLGQDLCTILEKEGFFVIKTNRNNLDITDLKVVEKFLSDKKPDLLVHCAAYTNVDGAETNLELTHTINTIGTENVAKVCSNLDVPVVYISTDYVFDGTKVSPYTPKDKTNPLNNYGLTKLQGEEAVKQYCKRYYIVRASWLYGCYGKNFVETMLGLAKNPEIKVVDDQIGCPTWTVDLANGILDIFNKPYDVYHICGSGHASWYEFACEIFIQAGLKVNVKPCSSYEFQRPAKRPKYSVMDNGGSCRNWKEALKEYLILTGRL
ncbi:MAG: dTDP-4-dehydrorhamnose reductase [Endomicrobium sp.]|jgi:dTDP-4-dehydrorhamnose reductase|nr:dTDP-4-dehydrorhamnose reductase [Endomicrobium sp.]